ncbi:hypothetical protein MA16_Dca007648 [Dendrobium catenatum]|uniref:Protein PIN-LIKES 3 n=1 Tax=Dendrobium catenatum TaxID=906689 RepID=A0A2I0X0W3_9ASPA|nr:hypothetical protein MA16_Dca007648 [Dendrobium catenatum]
MDLVPLFITAWIPVLKMLMVTGIGSIIATPSIDVLGEEARKYMNAVVFYVFNPSIVGNNLSKTFTLESVASTWFMPVNILLTFLLGSVFGWILNKITKVPSGLRPILLGCCASGNLGIMLLIVIPSTCNERSSPFGNPVLCQARALAYASLSMGVNDLIFWSYVYNIVRLSLGFEKENINITDNETSAPKSIEEGMGSNHANDAKLVDAKDSTGYIAGTENEENSQTMCKVQIGRKMSISVSGLQPAIVALRRLFTPSTYGVILGLTVGIISPFRKALIGETAPLRAIQGAISLLGDGAIPTTTLIMGGNLIKGFRKSDIKVSYVIGVVLVRYFLLPLAGIGIIKGAIHFGLLHPDPLYQFVLLVQYAVPPAMNMSVISQLFGAGESECSIIFFWTYALTLILFPLWSGIFMWLVS